MKSNDKKSSFIQLSFMIILTICVQVLTLVRSTIVASSFGASEDMDAYNFVNSIATFLFGIAASAVSTIIIPEYANKRNKRVTNTFITVIYGGMLIIAAVVSIFRTPIVNVLSNKGESFTHIATNIMVILLLSQYLMAFAGITTAFFQCENKHNVPKIINCICQGLVLAALIYMNGKMNITEYAMIIVGGNTMCFVVDTVVAFKSGWRFKPTLQLDSAGVGILARFVPVVFSGGVYQLSLLLDSMIASLLSTGMITILGYATQISSMASAIVVGNLLLYIYPKITRGVQETGYQDRFWEQARALHAIVCLMIAGFVCVGKEAVFILLNRGKFSREASEIVFYAATIYIVGQGISIIRDMIYRYFYAIGNTKIPAQNSILVSICNITVSLLLVKLVGFYGIIIGTVSASMISLVVIMIRFHKHIGFSGKLLRIIGHFLKNLAIMLITIMLVYVTKHWLPIENDLLRILVFGLETVIVYVGVQAIINKGALQALKKL